jgi:hypothetical protein
MILNVIAIVLSVLALASSTLLAFQQALSMKRANFLPVYVSLLSDMRSVAFHDRYYYLCERLGQEHDPQLGISGLPDDARQAIYDIAYFFQELITFRKLNILDGHVLDTMYGRIVRVWNGIAPFVERERELKGDHGPKLLCILEDYASDVIEHPPRLDKTMLHRGRTARPRR